jgi:hypothetical protein
MEEQKSSQKQKVQSEKSVSLVSINLKAYREMTEMSLSISHIYLIEMAYHGQYTKIESISDILKVKGYLQTLVRKDYLTEENKITEKGKELYEKLVSDSKDLDYIPKPVSKSKEQLFEEWWAEYPKTTHWNSGTRIFNGDRGLKIKKQQCRDKYIKILNEGFDHTDLVKALKYEIKLKKELSIKQGVNKMEYMKNTESYLNARVFENFIDAAKSSKDSDEFKQITDNIVNL